MCFLSLSLFKPRHLTQGRSERQRLGWSCALPDALTAYRRCVIPLHLLNPASEKAEAEVTRRLGSYLLSLSLNLPVAW